MRDDVYRTRFWCPCDGDGGWCDCPAHGRQRGLRRIGRRGRRADCASQCAGEYGEQGKSLHAGNLPRVGGERQNLDQRHAARMGRFSDLSPMPAARTSDQDLLARTALGLWDLQDLPSFRTGVLELLQALVGYDMAAYNEIGTETGELYVVADPADSLDQSSEMFEAFGELVRQNPLAAHFARTGDSRLPKPPRPCATRRHRTSHRRGELGTVRRTAGGAERPDHTCTRSRRAAP